LAQLFDATIWCNYLITYLVQLFGATIWCNYLVQLFDHLFGATIWCNYLVQLFGLCNYLVTLPTSRGQLRHRNKVLASSLHFSLHANYVEHNYLTNPIFKDLIFVYLGT
jgi:hypothetical protein